MKPPRRRIPKPGALPWIFWGLAFSHHLFLLLSNIDRSWPFPIFYEGDAETFYHYAQAILAGVPYDSGIPFHPPLFPLFLAGLHALLGEPLNNLVLRIVLAAIFSLQAPLLFALLRRFLDRRTAIAGVLLSIYSFGLGVISISAVSEGLYLLLLLGVLIVFSDLLRGTGAASVRREGAGPSPAARLEARGAVLGFLLGLLSLTRAEGIALAAALLGWLLFSRWRESGPARSSPALPVLPPSAVSAPRPSVLSTRPPALSTLRPWLVAVGVLALTLSPWVVRNALSISRVNRTLGAPGLSPVPTFVLTTAYGPLNFALANHENAPGWFTRDLLTSGAHQGVLDLHDPQHNRVFVHGTRLGLAFITSHPGEFLALCGKKLGLLARTLRLGWTQWDLPGGLTGTRYPVDLFSPDSALALFAHLALLGAGIWLLLRMPAGRRGRREEGEQWEDAAPDPRRYLRLCSVLLCLTLLSTVAFFGYVRQGALLLPFLSAIEGAPLAAAFSALSRRTPRASRLVIACLAVLWIAELAGAFQNRNYIASGETMAGSTMLNRDSVMKIRPAK